MRRSFLRLSVAAGLALSLTSAHAAEVLAYPESSPVGVSLEWYQHEMDLEVLGIQTSLPGVSDEAINSLKGQLDTKNKLSLLNLRLDYQIRPYLNTYGSIGKVTDKTEMDFSSVIPGVSPMVVDDKGTVYTIGARLHGTHGQWLTAINLAHSRLYQDKNSEEVTINSIVPSIGMQTDYGVISGSLLYQDVDASYSGAIAVPFVGDIPVTIHTENEDKLQIMAGWQVPLAKNYFLDANIGLNGKKQFLLQLNKRF